MNFARGGWPDVRKLQVLVKVDISNEVEIVGSCVNEKLTVYVLRACIITNLGTKKFQNLV